MYNILIVDDEDMIRKLIRKYAEFEGFSVTEAVDESVADALAKIGDGSEEIPNALRQGHIAYVINTRDPGSPGQDGVQIRQIATEYNVSLFTALDTVRVLLDVLEETTLTISTIDA